MSISKKTFHISKNFLSGSLRCAEFAITNVCIAKCSFCDIWKQTPKVFVNKDDGLRAIQKLASLGVSHITFTGGEPLMHPNIIEFIEMATKHNINNSVLDAAPSLLIKNDILKRLEAAGNDLISISFDSGDPEIMAKSRKIDNIMDEMKKAMELISRTSLKTMASVLIWNDNYDNLENVCIKAQDMGFDFISLNYPTFSDSDVYVLGGEGISFSRENVIQALESAIRLKKMGTYKIINSTRSMQNIINYIKDPVSAKFSCFGGSRVLFLDWFLNLHPCMQLSHSMGNVFDLSEKDLKMPTCNACNMSWYRDFSMLFHGLRSLPALLESLAESSKLIK